MFSPVGMNTSPAVILNPVPTIGQRLLTALQNMQDAEIDRILADTSAHNIPPLLIGEAVVLSIQKYEAEYVQKLLNLRNAAQIPPNGQWGNGHILIELINIYFENPLDVLPDFQGIEANCPYGLGDALVAIMNIILGTFTPTYSDPESGLFNKLLDHPNISHIASGPKYDLLGTLLLLWAKKSKKKCTEHDQEGISAFLNPKIAHLIQPNGEFGLGRILFHAAKSVNPFIVEKILAHPQAVYIGSGSTIIEKQIKKREENCGIPTFGFPLALLFLIKERYNTNRCYSNETFIQERLDIARAIINFTNTNNINLQVNDVFGLAETLTEAALKDEDLIPILLESHLSGQIQAYTGNVGNSTYGCLANALLNAVEKGFLNGVKKILDHANAKEITEEDLQSAKDVAADNGEEDIVDAIQQFIDYEDL